jgi:hypothetical protein
MISIEEAIEGGLKGTREVLNSKNAVKGFQDILHACGYNVTHLPKNECPCGISPSAWMFCSAGTCDICRSSMEFIKELQASKHTDRYVPCLTCGFHIVVEEPRSIELYD